MNGYKYRVLKVDSALKKLLKPLSADEYEQLEQDILYDGCHEPITVWNNIIIDGHTRYEICIRNKVPFLTTAIMLSDKAAAVCWICMKHTERITEDMQNYLIGKRYEVEKLAGTRVFREEKQSLIGTQVPQGIRGHSLSASNYHRTSQRLGDEYNISRSKVEKYGAYSKAIDTLLVKNDILAVLILTGQIGMSHSGVIRLSALSPLELMRFNIQSQKRYANACVEIPSQKSESTDFFASKPSASPDISVKDMPVFDPDAEISSLTLTVPSWIRLIERTGATNIDIVSDFAKDRLAHALDSLITSVEFLLDIIKE